MRIALISDIHGNRPALDAVMKSIGQMDVDEIWCLGDIVGYGADPAHCIETVLDESAICLAGNHDMVVCGALPMTEFSNAAGAAAIWTRETLDSDETDRLIDLQPKGESRGYGLYHASPRDPVWEYVLSVPQAVECMNAQESRVSFVGHSHVACFFSDDGSSEASGSTAESEQTLSLEDGRWLINPGSVGQPRDGDPRASYLVLDIEELKATFHRIEYPIDIAASAIIDAGLPKSLAERLFPGH